MEESTLRWPTDKEREEMGEVCSIVRCRIPKRAVSDFEASSLYAWKHKKASIGTHCWCVATVELT